MAARGDWVMSCLLALAIATGFGCSDKVPPDRIGQTPEMALQVAWEFERGPEDEAAVASMLEELVESTNRLHRGASGAVYRFGSEGTTRRYLLLSFLADSLGAADGEAAVFGLGDGSEGAPPLVIGQWTLGGFGPILISDYDEDGRADVAFCSWPEDEAADGHVQVFGLVDGSWYQIAEPTGELPSCEAE